MMTWFKQGVAGVSENHLNYSLLKLRNNGGVGTPRVPRLVSGKFFSASLCSVFVIKCGSIIQFDQADPG